MGSALHADNARNHIKRAVVIRECGINVQVLRRKIFKLCILRQLERIHPGSGDALHRAREVGGVVAHPRGADVKDGAARRDRALVIVRDASNSALVNVI
jgi:hypothetical protein